MRRVVAGMGKVLITLGILILLFVAYQLWGTGIYTARQQNKLENQFQQALKSTGSSQTPDFPAVTLYHFRLASFGIQLALWTTMGLLFGALTVGTSSRQLDPSVFDPQLAGNLTLIIQGLVVLFVGADLLVVWMYRRIRSVR